MAEAEPHYRSVYSVRGTDHAMFGEMFGRRQSRPGDIMYLSTDPRRNTQMRGSVMRNLDQASGIDFSTEGDDSDTEYEDGVDELDDDFFDELEDRLTAPHRPQVLPFKSKPETLADCAICFETKSVRPRICCDLPVCMSCVVDYLVSQVQMGNVKIQCLQTSCAAFVHRDEINYLLPDELKQRYARYLDLANQSPHCKTCPQCSHVRALARDEVAMVKKRRSKVRKNGLMVECEECGLKWCFLCQAPWHAKMTCREFSAGDKLLKDWSHQYQYGQLNAQKCPKCKIFIQRTTGCDQMTCSKCKTLFCYRCGQRFVGLKLIGNHFSRYSPLGCKYNFLPDRPAARRFIRGAAMSGKLLTGIVLGGLAVAAGAVLLGASVFILPAYGGYRLHKRRRRRQLARTLHHRYTQQQLLQQRGNSTFITLDLDTIPEEMGQLFRSPPNFDVDIGDEFLYEDEEMDIRERGMFTEIGFQLPHSRVTLLRQDASVHSGRMRTQSEEVVRGNVRVTTRVQEVVDEDGYSRVIANIVSNPISKSKEKRDPFPVYENLPSRLTRTTSEILLPKRKRVEFPERKNNLPWEELVRTVSMVEMRTMAEMNRSEDLSSSTDSVTSAELGKGTESGPDPADHSQKADSQTRSTKSSQGGSRGRPAEAGQSFTLPNMRKKPTSLSQFSLEAFHCKDNDFGSDESFAALGEGSPAGEKEPELFYGEEDDEEEEEEEGETQFQTDSMQGRSDETKEDDESKENGVEGNSQESRKVEDNKNTCEDNKKKSDESKKNDDDDKKKDNSCKEETKGDKNTGGEEEDEDDEKETKGCFTHLIVRKLSSLQVGVTDTTSSVKGQANGVKATSLNHRKSATWEKRSHRKESRSGSDLRSLDIRALLFQAEKFPDRSNLDGDPREEEKWREGEGVVREGGREWKKPDGKSVSDSSFPRDGTLTPGSDIDLQSQSQLRMFVSPCDIVTHL